ncbi:MAG: tetratricopeptide repeat-containing sensor histidine kinase, partial [Bacteroidota bacterium]
NNIASIYYKQRQFELSVEYYLRSLSIEEKHGNKNGIALKYNNLGSAYRDLGDRDQAIHYYNKSLEIREEIKDIYGLSSSKNNLAQLYLDEDDIKKSVEYYKSALLDAENSGSLEQQKVSYQGLAKSYKTAGRLDLALLNQEMYAVIKDSLLNEESAKQIAALEAQYENEKKEKEIELLSRERELNRIRMAEQEAVVKQRSTQRNFLIGAIISVLIISLLLLYNYRTQLKVKEDINKRNREFEDLRSSFFARISHEFRTPLTLISSPVEELINKYKSDQETKWTLQLVQRSSTKLLNLINQLLDLSKLEVGRLQLTVAKTDFIDWIRILAASFESLATDKQLKFSVIIPEAPIIFFHDKHKLEQIAENLLFNAFKFSSDHGEIVFKVLVEGEKIFIIVINEGTPIPQEELTKIFEPF